MTKRNPTRRTLSTADLALATGGYTLTTTFTLSDRYAATLANLTKSQDDIAISDIDNLK